MKFGPTRYLRCRHCGGAVNHRSLVQVDARFAELWSDGYVDSPMVPEQPLVVACGHCQQVVWLPELLEADDDGDDARDWQTLSEAQLWQWLELDGGEPSEHQLHVRIKLWQMANHRHRHGEAAVAWSERERDNLEALLNLLDLGQVTETLMAAEVSRQLGLFDQARELLGRTEGDLPLPLVSQMLGLIETRQTRVFTCRLHPGDSGGAS